MILIVKDDTREPIVTVYVEQRLNDSSVSIIVEYNGEQNTLAYLTKNGLVLCGLSGNFKKLFDTDKNGLIKIIV